mmetsp:Transcript_7289/g.23334  ORF Transcript_7289/g.23334 Transcript_7289/m.23334 type:complete len:213 (+) Transcript_7289:197-835(+)
MHGHRLSLGPPGRDGQRRLGLARGGPAAWWLLGLERKSPFRRGGAAGAHLVRPLQLSLPDLEQRGVGAGKEGAGALPVGAPAWDGEAIGLDRVRVGDPGRAELCGTRKLPQRGRQARIDGPLALEEEEVLGRCRSPAVRRLGRWRADRGAEADGRLKNRERGGRRIRRRPVLDRILGWDSRSVRDCVVRSPPAAGWHASLGRRRAADADCWA